MPGAGAGGDRVSGGWAGPIDLRLDRDVIAHRPAVVTVMLGMNDGGYRAFDPALFETYGAGYRHLVARLKQELPGVRLTLIQPSPFDDVTRPPGWPEGYNAVLRRYAGFWEPWPTAWLGIAGRLPVRRRTATSWRSAEQDGQR